MSGAVASCRVGSGPEVTGATRVIFRPLSMRKDDEDAWVIGRVDTGDFAVVPPVAHRAITLLARGCTIGEAAAVLQEETGKEFAVADFVAALDGLGYLAFIDGSARSGPDPVRPSLPWLRPHWLRWLHPAVPWLVLGLILAAGALMIARPALIPQYHDLVWSRYSGVVLAGDAALGWALVWLHELGHLGTARAAGVPARLSLSTRLQFLVAQTDVSGVWAAPRRIRLTVYLAGIAVNLVISAVCVLVNGLAGLGGEAHSLLAAATLESVLFVPWQLLIFMRTDLYFVIQDLAGCANLYADGSARVSYLARRLRYAATRGGSAGRGLPPDPARDLRPRERRAVRAYAWLLLCGTAGCAAAAAFITVPATITVVARAIGELTGSSPAAKADGAAALAVGCGWQIFWLRAWWRRHGGRVRPYLRTRYQRATGGR